MVLLRKKKGGGGEQRVFSFISAIIAREGIMSRSRDQWKVYLHTAGGSG